MAFSALGGGVDRLEHRDVTSRFCALPYGKPLIRKQRDLAHERRDQACCRAVAVSTRPASIAMRTSSVTQDAPDFLKMRVRCTSTVRGLM